MKTKSKSFTETAKEFFTVNTEYNDLKKRRDSLCLRLQKMVPVNRGHPYNSRLTAEFVVQSSFIPETKVQAFKKSSFVRVSVKQRDDVKVKTGKK